MEKKKKSPEFWRYAAFLVVLFGIFVWLISGLVNLQLKQSEEFIEKLLTPAQKLSLYAEKEAISPPRILLSWQKMN